MEKSTGSPISKLSPPFNTVIIIKTTTLEIIFEKLSVFSALSPHGQTASPTSRLHKSYFGKGVGRVTIVKNVLAEFSTMSAL